VRSITQDVHPRTLLDELCHLGLASRDREKDAVTLIQDGFTRRGDLQRMVEFLGDNVGDHLHAAVDNVISDEPAHFEQVRQLARKHWKALVTEAVPLMAQCLEANAQMPDAATHGCACACFQTGSWNACCLNVSTSVSRHPCSPTG
jgi:hypothetical protein